MTQESSSCIFCSIIAGTIPSSIIASNNEAIAIKDRSPRAPIHYLVLPKKHIRNFNDTANLDPKAIAGMAALVNELGASVEHQAYNLVVNNEKEAGQVVFHMHWHFMAGRDLSKGL